VSEQIQWSGKYLLGIEKVDAQHEHLFELVNSILSLHDDNSKENVKELLHDLREYMGTHFEDEQTYMRSIDYPDYEGHKKIHEGFVLKLNDVIRESGSIANIKKNIKYIAKVALVEHIIDEDTKIKAFVKRDEVSVVIDDVVNERNA
jgi:hemerythrin